MPTPKYRDEELHAAVGRAIRESREGRGWTQEQLAERLDVQPATVSRMETAKHVVSLSMLFKLGEILEIPVAQLLGLDEDERWYTENADEIALVTKWRRLDGDGRRLVLDLLGKLGR